MRLFKTPRSVIFFGAACIFGWLIVGCRGSDPAASAATVAPLTPPTFNGRPIYTGPHRTPKGMKGLTILGFNYTDTYISRFSVNGAGGGNLYVSSETSGGGGGTCCAPIADDMLLPAPVTIAWKRDGDAPVCTQTVLLDGPVPAEPYGLEVHFFQDGTIQVAFSAEPSPPRLRLPRFSPALRKPSGNVDNDAKFSECKRAS